LLLAATAAAAAANQGLYMSPPAAAAAATARSKIQKSSPQKNYPIYNHQVRFFLDHPGFANQRSKKGICEIWKIIDTVLGGRGLICRLGKKLFDI